MFLMVSRQLPPRKLSGGKKLAIVLEPFLLCAINGNTEEEIGSSESRHETSKAAIL